MIMCEIRGIFTVMDFQEKQKSRYFIDNFLAIMQNIWWCKIDVNNAVISILYPTIIMVFADEYKNMYWGISGGKICFNGFLWLQYV